MFYRINTRLPDGVSLSRQEVLHRDEVTKDEPEHDVLDVQADERLEERQRHYAQLQTNGGNL